MDVHWKHFGACDIYGRKIISGMDEKAYGTIRHCVALYCGVGVRCLEFI